MQTRVLYMTFKNTLGNSCTITVDDPRDDIEEQDIITTMNLIKEKIYSNQKDMTYQLVFLLK